MTRGVYGNPPQVSIWFMQTLEFIFALAFTKLIILVPLQLPFMLTFGKWALSPLHNPHTQLIVVMLVFPLIMNIFQFWLVDNIIMAKDPHLLTLSPGRGLFLSIDEELMMSELEYSSD